MQFIGGSRGAQLMEILSLGGQPEPQMWDHYEKWWLQELQNWNDREKLQPNSPDWAIRVMWLSKSFMHEYWKISNVLMINPFQLTLEEMMWSFGHMAQVSQPIKMKMILI